jgi:hypothetical protein
MARGLKLALATAAVWGILIGFAMVTEPENEISGETAQAMVIIGLLGLPVAGGVLTLKWGFQDSRKGLHPAQNTIAVILGGLLVAVPLGVLFAALGAMR